MHYTFQVSRGTRRVLAGLTFLILLLPATAVFAQQLRLVEGATTAIDPTIYRAYYGILTGAPHTFTFSTDADITPVSFVIFVPDTSDAKTDITAAMVDTQHPDSEFVVGDGSMVEWTRFFDTAGRDSYLAGPTLTATIPKGSYEVRVSSDTSDVPYVLVVSGKESFSIAETLRRYGTVPSIKSQFFGKSAAEAYLTPLLLWPILGLFILAALIVFLTMLYLRRRTIQARS